MTATARTAIFSLTEQLDLGFPQGAAEQAAPALLHGTAGSQDCFVHKITCAGATLRLRGPVQGGERGRLELPFGLTAEGALVGDADAFAFRFDQPLDVVGALARCLAALPAERRRMPRIELRQRLCVRHSGQVDFAWTRNLSPTGAGVETRATLTPGEPVEVMLDGLRPIRGEVRWAEDGQAGIAFTEELGWQLLMPWLRKIASQRPAPVSDSAPQGTALGAIKDALRVEIASHARSGAGWWNVQLSAISSTLVEFESATAFPPLSSLWLSLPEIGGWPVRVIECHGVRHVAEFRLPLRRHEMTRLTDAVRPR